MIENIEKAIYQNLRELFSYAALDQMAGDMDSYRKNLEKIASIAEILGIDTQIIQINIHFKPPKTQ